jgi:hypothetical protein
LPDQPTCGQGLANNRVIPEKLAELTASLAQVLEVHMEALDLEDENARTEYDVYGKLVAEHREIASRLRATAEEMVGCRDLPMGKHDQKAMSSPKVAEAFEHFVTAQQQLLGLLQERIEQDRKMLDQIRGAPT